MIIRKRTHYKIAEGFGLYVAPDYPWSESPKMQSAKVCKFSRLGFFANDILCGHPIGAAISAQEHTEEK